MSTAATPHHDAQDRRTFSAPACIALGDDAHIDAWATTQPTIASNEGDLTIVATVMATNPTPWRPVASLYLTRSAAMLLRDHLTAALQADSEVA